MVVNCINIIQFIELKKKRGFQVSQVQSFLLVVLLAAIISVISHTIPPPLFLVLTNLNSSAFSVKDENLADLHFLLTFLFFFFFFFFISFLNYVWL